MSLYLSLVELVKVLPSISAKYRLSIESNLESLDFTDQVHPGEDLPAELAQLEDAISHYPHVVRIISATISTSPFRPNHSWAKAIEIKVTGNIGELSTDHSAFGDGTKISYLELVGELGKIFNLQQEDILLRESLGETADMQLQYRESVVGDLQATVEKLGIYLADAAQKQAEDLRVANERLRTEWEQKNSELQDKYQQQVDALADQEAELNSKIRDFDTRQSKYARRGLLEDLKKEIKDLEAFKLSNKAQNKRWPVHAGSAVSLTLFGLVGTFGALWLHDAVEKQAVTAWLFVSMTTAGTLGVGSTIIFYLRWANSWFSEHLRQEAFIRRMRTDAIRSSWLVELLFEWHDQGNEGPLPPELLKPLSAGLFAADDTVQAEVESGTPVEKLVRDLRTISIGTDGLKISRNRQ